jgi:hypothetical protein
MSIPHFAGTVLRGDCPWRYRMTGPMICVEKESDVRDAERVHTLRLSLADEILIMTY